MLSVHDLPAVELPERPIVLTASGGVLLVRHKQPAFETDEHSNPFLQLCVKLGPSHLQTETIEGRTRRSTALPGDVGLYPANLHYSFRWDREAEFLQIFFAPDLVRSTSLELYGEDRSHLFKRVRNGHDPFLLQLALTLMSEAENGVSGAHADIFAKAAIARLFSEELVGADAMDALTSAIKFRVDYPWSVEEMADYAGLSPHHFSRRFKERIGQSPYKYLLQQRVKRAAELLADTPRSVAAVAQEVGFASQGQLNHHFRRVYGSTPTLFRQKRTKREIQSTI